MQNTLCLDLGNTRWKAAVFTDDMLKEALPLDNDAESVISGLVEKYSIRHSILSSVVDHPASLEQYLEKNTGFHRLSHESRLPFTLSVGRPESVGADRIAISAASVHFFPGKNTLAIGSGSCITYNFISMQKEFLGGSISPGMEMRFRAMHQFTARLPLAAGDWNIPLVGYDTKTNLQSGVVLGIAKEMDGIIDAYAERYGNFNVLLTGGDIAIFEPHLKNKIFADPHLLFKGLYAISQINRA